MEMFDPLELPPEVRVVIPRVRNGDILYKKSGSADGEIARALGILAVLIAEAVCHECFFDTAVDALYTRLFRDYEEEYGVDLFKFARDKRTAESPLEFRLKVEANYAWWANFWKKVMRQVMYSMDETIEDILEGIELQDSAEREALDIFRSFIVDMDMED